MGDFLYLLNLWILLFLQIGIGKFLIYNDNLRHNFISCIYVYENQRLPGKWHSFPGLQMVSNFLVHGSLAWLKKNRAQLKLQQKKAFQSSNRIVLCITWVVMPANCQLFKQHERHDIAEILLTLALNTGQSINQSNNTTEYYIRELR